MNKQVPDEAVERKAGQGDEIIFNAYVMQAECERTVQIPTTENTITKTAEDKSIEVFSSELGRTIKEIPVQDGRIKNKTNTKEQDEGREID